MVHYSKMCSLCILIIFAQIVLATTNTHEPSIDYEENMAETQNFDCHPFPFQNKEKYPIELTGKANELYKMIIKKDYSSMPVQLATDGKLVSVKLGEPLGMGGSKTAVSFFLPDGSKSKEVLMMPNVNILMWNRMVEEETIVSDKMSKLGILNVQSKRTDLYFTVDDSTEVLNKNDEATITKLLFASYKCPSFESLKSNEIFVFDANKGSSTWPTQTSILNPKDDRFKVETWKPILEPLVQDLYKLASNNLLPDTGDSDSSNFAVVRTEKSNPEYVIRYFGFDFSQKSGRVFGKSRSADEVTGMVKNCLQNNFLGNIFWFQQNNDGIYEWDIGPEYKKLVDEFIASRFENE